MGRARGLRVGRSRPGAREADQLKGELDEALRGPSAARCEAFVRRVEEERTALATRLDALLAREDVDALGKVLSAAGKPLVAPPPPGKTYGETAETYRLFDEEVQAKGRAAFAGRAITWETWKAGLQRLARRLARPRAPRRVPEASSGWASSASASS